MTRASLREYGALQRARYRQATRTEKRALLNEIVAVTGLHRKSAIRLRCRAQRSAATPSRSGRPLLYGPAVGVPATVLWEAAGTLGLTACIRSCPNCWTDSFDAAN